MRRETDNFGVTRITLERWQLAAHQGFSRMDGILESMTLEQREDLIAHRLIYELRAFVVGDKIITDVKHLRWPETWWDAFKHRFFSDSLLNRWPVKWHVERVECKEIRKVCPHIAVPSHQRHVQWFMYEGGLPKA